MGGVSTKTLAAGFIAAALAVLVFHQTTIFVFGLIGWIPNARPWNFTGNQIGVPLLINGMFWGGMWGLLYAYFKDKWPSPFWLGGIVFGILGSTIIGGWIIMPLIRGTPMFAGFNPLAMLRSASIGGMFGLGTALIFPHVAKRLG